MLVLPKGVWNPMTEQHLVGLLGVLPAAGWGYDDSWHKDLNGGFVHNAQTCQERLRRKKPLRVFPKIISVLADWTNVLQVLLSWYILSSSFQRSEPLYWKSHEISCAGWLVQEQCSPSVLGKNMKHQWPITCAWIAWQVSFIPKCLAPQTLQGNTIVSLAMWH